MRVLEATADQKNDWNRISNTMPGSLPLNRFEWKNILRDSYGIKPLFVYVSDGVGQMQGIAATYMTDDIYMRKNIFSTRYGLLAADDDCLGEIIRFLKDYCLTYGIHGQQFTTGEFFSNITCFSSQRKTMQLSISENMDSAWDSLKSKTRNMVRKAIKEGLKVEEGKEHIHRFYEIYVDSMLGLKVPMHSKIFFDNVLKEFGDDAELSVVYREGKALAGMITLFGSTRASYPWQVSLSGTNKYAPNQLLIWQAMRSCIDRKISVLDMGESVENGPVYLFKKNFGGSPVTVHYSLGFEEDLCMKDSLPMKGFRKISGTIHSNRSNLLQKFGTRSMAMRTSIFLRKRGRTL